MSVVTPVETTGPDHLYASFDYEPLYDASAHDAYILQRELCQTFRFNQQTVLTRLGVDVVPKSFVEECYSNIHSNQEFVENWEDLQSHVAYAFECDEGYEDQAVYYFDEREEEQKKWTHSSLSNILNLIISYTDVTGNASLRHRILYRPQSNVEESETHIPGFMGLKKPHFILLDQEPGYGKPGREANNANRQARWRHTVGFVQATPSKRHSPSSQAPILVEEATEFAWIHMAARPFQLFSVGLLIYGLTFCVAIFDRRGVTFSPEGDLSNREGWDLFIRIVRRMACDLSPTELGRDPTVEQLPAEHHAVAKLQRDAMKHGLTLPDDLPHFSVSTRENGAITRWGTVAMLSTSISLFGPGTTTWLVRELKSNGRLTGPLLVMKTSWRSKSETAESDVYRTIQNRGIRHDCIARFKQGGDVYFPDSNNRKISVQELRDGNLLGEAPSTDLVLHRLFLSSVGCPIWKYKTEEELLKGIKAALQGHKYLLGCGILHRNVNAGNVMLAIDGSLGCEGFLADIGCARFDENIFPSNGFVDVSRPEGVPVAHRHRGAIDPNKRAHPTHLKFLDEAPVQREESKVMGTHQFMSQRLMRIEESLQRHNRDAEHLKMIPPPEHEVRDDIESFLWVLSYALMRHALLNFQEREDCELLLYFYEAFERVGIRGGLMWHRLTELKWFIPGVSQAMVQWVRKSENDFLKSEKYCLDYGLNLTYDDLSRVLDEGVAFLRSNP